MSELAIALLTAGLGLISGAVLALLGSRQRLEVEYDIELRKQRIDAYQALWKILEPLAYYAPSSEVTHALARQLAEALRSWYFEVGGLFLSEASREAYFDLQKGLGGVIKPPPDADDVPLDDQRFEPLDDQRFEPLDDQRFERLRAIASRLRTTLTQDVATRVKTRHPEPLLPRLRRRLSGGGPVEVTVRRGWLWGDDERECYSVLVQNQLSSPSVHVNKVYFDTPEEQLPLIRKPVRLGPGGHWEVAVPADTIPAAPGDVRQLVRAELSDGSVIASSPGADVEPHPDFLFPLSSTGTAGDERR